MANASMTPASRPRKGVIGVLALLGAGALTATLVLAAGEAADPPEVAGAVELATFTSCDDLAAWGAEAGGAEELSGAAGSDGVEEQFNQVGGAIDDSGAASGAADADMGAPAPTSARAEAEAGDEGGEAAPADQTNVAVEGVDEIDLVDRLSEDVVLVASASRLAVVDLAAGEVVEGAAVPWDAQVTHDAEAGIAWVVGHSDQGGVQVERYAVDVDGLEPEGSWTTVGTLVDARRVGDELHVVATDGFWAQPAFAAVEEDMGGAGGGGAVTERETTIPFDGGPVPCDEVLHPEGPSDPAATLIVTLPATGAVEPVRATEVVGSGSLVHVTTEAVFLATPQWDESGTTTTGIHRFDLATLEATGSGSVAGSLLDEFSMSELDGALRVAVTEQGGFGVVGPAVGRPIPIEGDAGVAVDVAPPPTVVEEGPILNEIVVLDTDGALDEIGRTERFGHPGETLHGIRFAGTTAYAVTFLQTDPFYVVDLSDPAAPQVVGEVELPGFSSYLHPLDDGLVVGFGPGADGRTAAKLFDVSDPTAPEVVGDLALGDDSAVAYDHHAYLDLGDGRFAVPATSYRAETTSAVVVVGTAGGELVEEARHEVRTTEGATRVITAGDGFALLAGPQIVVLDEGGDETARIGL